MGRTLGVSTSRAFGGAWEPLSRERGSWRGRSSTTSWEPGRSGSTSRGQRRSSPASPTTSGRCRCECRRWCPRVEAAFRAASSSGSCSRAPWSATRKCCCWTRRRARSTTRSKSSSPENLAQAGVTRIVVAHRLSTIRRADRIVVLERGRVVEEGTLDELMAANGLFASLARRQLCEKRHHNPGPPRAPARIARMGGAVPARAVATDCVGLGQVGAVGPPAGPRTAPPGRLAQ
jgi:hypothetical protein